MSQVGGINGPPEAVDAFRRAYLELQKKLGSGTVNKDRNNPHFHSKYASLTAVNTLLMPLLTEHGFMVTQIPMYSERFQSLACSTILFHVGGGELACEYPIRPVKNTPQAEGSAFTYARRYTLLSLFNLAPDDDDGNSASATPPAERRPPPPASAGPKQQVDPESPPIETLVKGIADMKSVIVPRDYQRAMADLPPKGQRSYQHYMQLWRRLKDLRSAQGQE